MEKSVGLQRAGENFVAIVPRALAESAVVEDVAVVERWLTFLDLLAQGRPAAAKIHWNATRLSR